VNNEDLLKASATWSEQTKKLHEGAHHWKQACKLFLIKASNVLTKLVTSWQVNTFLPWDVMQNTQGHSCRQLRAFNARRLCILVPQLAGVTISMKHGDFNCSRALNKGDFQFVCHTSVLTCL